MIATKNPFEHESGSLGECSNFSGSNVIFRDCIVEPIDIVSGNAANNLEPSTNKILSNTILGVTNSVTSTLYMPLMQGGYSQSRQLGVAQLLSGPVDCEEQQCYQLKVTCPNLNQSFDATLKVGDPFSDQRGTILFATGWTGTYFWDGEE
jgi:hypothetical protein